MQIFQLRDQAPLPFALAAALSQRGVHESDENRRVLCRQWRRKKQRRAARRKLPLRIRAENFNGYAI